MCSAPNKAYAMCRRENRESEQKLQELSGLGGDSVSLATRRGLEALMVQKVAVEYSWVKQKEKRKFSSFAVCKLICSIVRIRSPDSELAPGMV
ncbi:hypothetical protein HPB47_014989 [Ixodes persulcatus]|uniref:Uncharacterized protein n=1 Tax=Ixodes persulcatus TaxID=34615 RepID=A0AC60QVV2_IXOPE|nr:hypothetical protein HPB47_014989 [Ixodes persulcatus]